MEIEAAETYPRCESITQRPAISRGPEGCRETVTTCDICGGSEFLALEAAARYWKAMRCASSAWVNLASHNRNLQSYGSQPCTPTTRRTSPGC
jgi:hypothetical protein